ncbi:phage head-tail adapter protein, partial [Listeria monocytogenes]|nr:phage head-tail adapter protein [Listeria monocytogenes]
MPIKTKYERPEIVAGDLNTPVTFFEVKPNDGPEP